MSESSSRMTFSQTVEGLQIPGIISVEAFRSALNYKPRDDDVFIVTYPKCGTTWTQNILILIFNKGQPLKSQIEFHTASPYLDMTGAIAAEEMPRPNAIKFHLPYHLTPKSDKTKYIYVARNPKDCCVSYFHHMKNFPFYGFTGTFNDYFELFISGNIDYGDYFDHVLGWYAHRNDSNVLFLTYEEMKEDTAGAILKIASFIDDSLYAETLRNDPEILNNIIKFSSFSYMKDTVNKQVEQMMSMSKEEITNSFMNSQLKRVITTFVHPNLEKMCREKDENSCFVRKGIVGDWKNYFSESQSRRMDEKFAERMKGTDLESLWKNYM
ncbi:Sulfotransferase 1C2A, partial [Stegodyphus mimosarum]